MDCSTKKVNLIIVVLVLSIFIKVAIFPDKVFACDGSSRTSCASDENGVKDICYRCGDNWCGAMVCCGGGSDCVGPSTTTPTTARVWIPPTCTNGVFTGCTISTSTAQCNDFGGPSDLNHSDYLQQVCINACRTLTNPNLLCTTPVTIKGKVIDETSQTGIAGVKINSHEPVSCGSLTGVFTTDANGNFSTSIPFGKDYCLRGDTSTTVSPLTGVECQYAGYKADPDSCGGHNDQATDDAFVIKYNLPRPAGPRFECNTAGTTATLKWETVSDGSSSYLVRVNKPPFDIWCPSATDICRNPSGDVKTYHGDFGQWVTTNSLQIGVTPGIAYDWSVQTNRGFSISQYDGGRTSGGTFTCQNTTPVCAQAVTAAIDSNNTCEEFPTACLPSGWTAIGGSVCPACYDGPSVPETKDGACRMTTIKSCIDPGWTALTGQTACPTCHRIGEICTNNSDCCDNKCDSSIARCVTDTTTACNGETPIPQVDGNGVCTMTSPGSCPSAGNTLLAGRTTCPACDCVTGVTSACTSSEGAGTQTCVTKNISGLSTCGTFTGVTCNSTCSTGTPIPQVDRNGVCTMTSPGSCPSAGNTLLVGQTTCPEVTVCTQCLNQPTRKGLGDADCNGQTTINDVSIWRAEYIAGRMGVSENNTWHADFNCDGKVDLDDLHIWTTKFTTILNLN